MKTQCGLKPKKIKLATIDDLKDGDRVMLLEQNKNWTPYAKSLLMAGAEGTYMYGEIEWDLRPWSSDCQCKIVKICKV
jgi:hypothetical protein